MLKVKKKIRKNNKWNFYPLSLGLVSLKGLTKKIKKNYIGKGTTSEKFENGVKMPLNVEDLLKFQHTFKAEKYITFEVARMKNPYKYGRTHTPNVTVLEE